MTANSERDNTTELYRINDVLSSLAQELGVPVTTEWEDGVLNDLTHSIEQAFQAQRDSTKPVVSASLRARTSATIEGIVRLKPTAWGATRGVNYSDLPEDVKVMGRHLYSRHSRKFALMFLNVHGLEAMTMEPDSAYDFTSADECIVRVPDFSEYTEADLTEFYSLLAVIGLISENLRDEALLSD